MAASTNGTASGLTVCSWAFSGMSNSVIVGTKDAIVKTQDYRRAPEGRWNKKLVLDMQTTFEEYICPTEHPAPIDVHIIVVVAHDIPEAAEPIPAPRRMRLMPRDFAKFGYTAGCPDCVQLQRGGGISRNHSKSCQTCLEDLLKEAVEGQARKQRASEKRE